MSRTKKRKAFTLVELLVVISIIALLMSILMPALAAVRKKAQDIVCRAKLRSWGTLFALDAEQNNGYLRHGLRSICKYVSTGKYYQDPQNQYEFYDDKKLLLCPSASKVTIEMGEPYGGNLGIEADAAYPNRAWGYYWQDDRNSRGSYGRNSWIKDAKPGTTPYPGCPAKWHWKQLNVRPTEKIPMIGDSWYSGAYPSNTDAPSRYAEGGPMRGGGDFIRAFCVDRHNAAINMLFMNLSARKVGLKELWTFKWHRNSKTNLAPPIWSSEAPWMVKMKDY